jgi:chromosome segregation ATPase
MEMNMKKTIKAAQVPVTVEMLQLVKQELKSDLRAIEHRLDNKLSSLENKLDNKIGNLDTKIGILDAKIGTLDNKISNLENKVDCNQREVLTVFEKINANIFQIKVLVEEQNSRNNYVLDGHTQLVESQTNIKVRLANMEKKVLGSVLE